MTYSGNQDAYRGILRFFSLFSPCSLFYQLFGTRPLSAQDLLFTNKQGKRLTRQGIRHILRKYASLSQKDNPDDFGGQEIYPHLLRHSRATHLVNTGVNIYNVKDFLGHAHVQTTQIYLTSNPEAMRKAIEKVASQTVPDSVDYYSETEKQSLMEFLETLV